MARKNPYAKPDAFTKKAKDAGFPARSVYKLEEIDRRVRLLRGGMHVLDLGASPGSWALYAAQKISPSGRLLARAELKKHFTSERLIRPEGTRTVSYELFIIGIGRRAIDAIDATDATDERQEPKA